MNELIAYCGLDCGKCEARRATLDNDDALREKVARKWSELNGVEITPAMINCAGCRVDGVKTPYCESLCPIRQCALGRRVETCGGCAEMGACGKLAQITGNNAEARRNLATIRLEEHGDYREVETLVREAFWNVYRPGCMEHYVLHRLRDSPNFIRELDFVMELGGRVIGQNVFVRAEIKLDGGRALPIATMGPICVAPEFKRQGYGKRLLDYSLEKAAALGVGEYASRGTSASTARAASRTRESSASATPDCLKARTTPSSCAGNSSPATLTESGANTRRRGNTSSARTTPTASQHSRRASRRRRS